MKQLAFGKRPTAVGLPGILPLFLIGLATASRAELSPDELRLSAEARGVLAHQCTKCHGQQKQKGGLRLDTKAAAMKGGDSGAVLVAGQPGESVLIKRITLSKTHDDVMPPDGGSIEPAEIETLRKWVAAGAPWPEGETAGIVFQRAPIAPRKPEFPAGTEAFENPDRQVRRRVFFAAESGRGRQPVDDRTFLRRASLDAVGLLPTWEEVADVRGRSRRGRGCAARAQ